MIDLHQQIRS